MKMRRTLTTVLSALALTGVFAKDTRVLVLKDGGQRAIHRFAVANAGATNETWSETAPLCTFASDQSVCNVIPAHGYYYVCYGNGQVWRFTKEGVKQEQVGTLAGGECFEMSADQSYIYGSKLAVSTGGNYIGQLHLGFSGNSICITNDIAQARCLAWGADDLLYVSSRSNGNGTDYWGNPITAGMYRGIQAFDVSNGRGPVLKHYYKASSSSGGCAVDVARGHVYSFSGNTANVFGLAEFAPDGERSEVNRAAPVVSLGNPFSGALIAGFAYTADWKNPGPANVYRFNPDNTATLVTSISNVTGGAAESLATIRAIREDVFPEQDSTLAITKLCEYWSFNHAGETSTDIARIFTSKVNPKRTAALNTGFTAGVRGVSREGIWCAAGANGRLESAIIVPKTGDFTITCFLGFPSALDGGQMLFYNPKMSISVTADGFLAAEIQDGADGDGTFATGTSVTGTTSLADGAWHQIGVSRHANKLEIWVDGVREQESATTTSVAVYDDLNTQWYFLKSTNRNQMFLDELRIYGGGMSLAAGDYALLRRIATNADLVVPRDPASRSHAAATAVGTVLAHADAEDHAWGVPMVIADRDGTTLYATADFGRGKGENNQSVIWKSTDVGDTWSRVKGEPSFACLSLFKFDTDGQDTFRMAGFDADSSLAWGFTTSDGCATLTNPRLQNTYPLPAPWYPAPCPSGFARNVALAGGLYNLDVLAYGKGYFIGPPVAVSNRLNVTGFRSGSAFVDEVGTATLFCHQTVRRHQNATNAAPREVLGVVRREQEKALLYRGAAAFPGASRPFGVVWDATSRRYWAAVTYAEDGSQTPWLRANRLALYSATNLVAWQKCCDLAVAGTPATVGFNTPNLTVAGNDLVIVFGASLNDGAGLRDVNVSNYILSKRVANFRALVPADEPVRTRTLLVGDNSAGRILRLEEDEETGEWINAGYFAPDSYTVGRYGVGSGDEILYRSGKVWVLRGGRIFAFEADGSFTGTCFDLTLDRTVVPFNPDGMCLSYDGRYIYSIYAFVDKTHANTRYIYRTEVATGVTTQFCSSNDEGLYTRLWKARTLAGLPDGSVVVACRDGNLLFRLSSEGRFVEDVWTGIPAPQTLYFDRRARKLYASGFSCKLYCWDYATGAKTNKEGLANIIGLTGDDRGRVFGTAYNSPAGVADLLADGGAFTTAGHREILPGGETFHRCCFFDTRLPPGTCILVR